MPLDLWSETRGLLDAFDGAGLEYALAGAVALAVHGVVRATSDVDVLVWPEDAEAALSLARDLGFDVPALPMRFADGMEIRRTTKLSPDGDALTLDLLLVDENLRPVFADRLRIEAADGPVSVVSRNGLIQMKGWAARERDLDDIRRLRELDR